jgi:hypothetical protein
MRIHLAAALVAALTAIAPPIASAQNTAPATTTRPAPSWATLKTYRGTITRVDVQARTVTTRDAAGATYVFDAPSSLPSSQLAGFQPGESVTVTFYDGIEVRSQAGAPAVATSVDPENGLRVAPVTIAAVNPAARTVTFNGPRGRYTRTVADNFDPNVFRSLTVGARVNLAYFEYVQSMTRTASAPVSAVAPPVPPPATTSNRFTVYTLYGVDNSFTGKMIEAATGRTTTGVPINLDETSFDDVYGRLGLLTIGVGYRMSPRMEAVASFVYSNSSANFEPTQIGTAGTSPQVPLKVSFTNYRYVGVEVGQRFFFAPHARVTPFAGWLVGLNRNQDIRGTFVGVPANVTPGLAAQDGKFFERSWAFSVGPRGGVLIAAGPIDVVAETQLRFLGGLSDVDWLVEEGLRDINSKSQRWSVPILAGVRFKF